jgi:hypothetical protein
VSTKLLHPHLPLIYYTRTQQEQQNGPAILPPKPVVTKGRPRKKRLTSATENTGPHKKVKFRDCNAPEPSQTILPASAEQQQLDDTSHETRGRRRCGNCGKKGHYATTCGSSRKGSEKVDG